MEGCYPRKASFGGIALPTNVTLGKCEHEYVTITSEPHVKSHESKVTQFEIATSFCQFYLDSPV